MNTHSIHIEAPLNDEERDTLRAGMRRYIEQHVPWETYEELTIVLRDSSGQFFGVAMGDAGRGWLKVVMLWVHEDVRCNGHGEQLLNTLESEAIKRGCRNAFLDTFDYQAKPFYEKRGYKVFGTLEDYPAGHSRYYMRKQLATQHSPRLNLGAR